MGWFGNDDDDGAFSQLDVGFGQNSQLWQILMSGDIVPGDDPSYQVCKTIFVYHPLGEKMAAASVKKAQSQEREIRVGAGPEERLVKAFREEWKAINADQYIRDTKIFSKVYGQTTLICGQKDVDPAEPLDFATLAGAELYFNVLDPLNTSGSVVLNQDPNAPDFLKPKAVRVGSQHYHPSRSVVMFNGPPVYIEWTNSAFGYTGRSVYQRGLYALKTFLQTMITDDMITKKAGLLVAKMKQPGSVVNNRMTWAFGQKRQALKNGTTGNVLGIGVDDSIETLNMMNLEGPARFARDNVLKNIATSADMPAALLNQDTLAEGFGEGTEDAKMIAEYIRGERTEMDPLYDLFNKIVMRRAWNEDFYQTVQDTDPDYKDVPYETAYRTWEASFEATWPNLLEEPQEKKDKSQEFRFKSACDIVEKLAPFCADQTNKAILATWLAEVANGSKFFATPLDLDVDEIENYEPPVMGAAPEEDGPARADSLRVVK